MAKTKKNLKEVLEAIKGSGGVKYVVAQRLGVTRVTLDSYLTRWATAQAALDAEDEDTGDMAEAVIRRNIELAIKNQTDTKQPVDSGDAWRWLRTRRRERYAERQELTGADGGPIGVKVVEVMMSPEGEDDDDGDAN